jgi:hypothetical protein
MTSGVVDRAPEVQRRVVRLVDDAGDHQPGGQSADDADDDPAAGDGPEQGAVPLRLLEQPMTSGQNPYEKGESESDRLPRNDQRDRLGPVDELRDERLGLHRRVESFAHLDRERFAVAKRPVQDGEQRAGDDPEPAILQAENGNHEERQDPVRRDDVADVQQKRVQQADRDHPEAAPPEQFADRLPLDPG